MIQGKRYNIHPVSSWRQTFPLTWPRRSHGREGVAYDLPARKNGARGGRPVHLAECEGTCSRPCSGYEYKRSRKADTKEAYPFLQRPEGKNKQGGLPPRPPNDGLRAPPRL